MCLIKTYILLHSFNCHVSFFLYISSFCVCMCVPKRLIPNEFWRRSECKNLPPKVTLKVAWESSWTVNLSPFMGCYLMERKGWEKFLNDNHLGDNEFLTFTNEGNNCITVDIFQKNCIEILKPLNTSSSSKLFSSFFILRIFVFFY